MRSTVSSLLMLLLLAACAAPVKTPVDEASTPLAEVESEVRQPASEESAGIQVQPLQNPAVQQLLASAAASEAAGKLDQAAQMLERGLRIQPRDPELLQGMAEVRLQQQAWRQAINFATRSYESSARVGELCARNWRTIALAQQRLEQPRAAENARHQLQNCMRQRPRKY